MRTYGTEYKPTKTSTKNATVTNKASTPKTKGAFTIEKPQDAVKIYEEFRAVYRDGKNPPKREYTKGHFKRGAE